MYTSISLVCMIALISSDLVPSLHCSIVTEWKTLVPSTHQNER